MNDSEFKCEIVVYLLYIQSYCYKRLADFAHYSVIYLPPILTKVYHATV